MLSIHPLELFRVEDRRLFLETIDAEQLYHFGNGHDLAIATWRPAEKREEVEHGAGKKSVVLVISDRRRAVTLAQLLPVDP